MLLKEHEEIKKYTEISTGVNFHSIAPSITEVEESVIIPIIGIALYENLNTAYNVVSPTLSAAQTKLLVALQKAIANIACGKYVPFADVQMSDAGIRGSATPEQKGAYK